MQPAKDLQLTRPMIVEAVTLFNRIEEIQQQIGRRAYELFEGRGYEHGHAFDDWTAAEAELLLPISVEMIESTNQFKLTAKVPGFAENNIEIAVEPRRVIWSGKTEKALDSTAKDAELSGPQAAMFFQALDLPVEVDTQKAKAQLKNGVLTLTLPKLSAKEKPEAEAVKEIPVE